MLTYSFENIGKIPMYIHLYNCIKNDIIQNVLKANEILPSKRALAAQLGISVVTVENAYMQLLCEGYIRSKQRSGYFVSDIVHSPLKKIEPEPTEKVFSQEKKYIDFASSSVTEDSFPFSVWSTLARQVLAEHESELLKRQGAKGTKKLREVLSRYLKQFRDIDVSPEQIIIGAGTEQLCMMLINLFGRDSIFAVEDPGYQKITRIYNANGLDCRFIPVLNDGAQIDELKASGAEIFHVSPSHHFPTGVVTPIKKRLELLAWAKENDRRYLIEDDYDSEFRLRGKPLPTLSSIDVSGKVVYMNTFSKTLSPAIRISYMILPEKLLKRFEETWGFSSCGVSCFEQYTLAKFIRNGHMERHINRMRRNYKIKRDKVIQSLCKEISRDMFTIREEDGGLHFVLELKGEYSDKLLKQAAKDKGVNICCLSEYYNKRTCCKQASLLMNYIGIDDDDIATGVKKLAEVIKDCKNKSTISPA